MRRVFEPRTLNPSQEFLPTEISNKLPIDRITVRKSHHCSSLPGLSTIWERSLQSTEILCEA